MPGLFNDIWGGLFGRGDGIQPVQVTPQVQPQSLVPSQPEGPNKWAHALSIVGSTLQDVGNGGRSNNLANTEAQYRALQQEAQRKAVAQKLAAAFGGSPTQAGGGTGAPQKMDTATLTPLLAQAAAQGINVSPYITLMKSQEHGRMLSPDEAKSMGFKPGSVVMVDTNGVPRVLQASDVKSSDAMAQQLYLKEHDPNLAISQANLGIAREKLGLAKDKQAQGELSPDALFMAAAQYNVDHKMPALGRTAAARSQIINEAAKQLVQKGLSPEQAMSKVAEYQGSVAGQRALGTRTAYAGLAANEFMPMVAQAKDAMSKVSRSGFMPLDKLQQAYQKNTNDPNLARAVAATNAVINTYARMISPIGQPTVEDKKHAYEMLSTAQNQEAYNAVLDQMRMEGEAAMQAPEKTRGEFRGMVTGESPGAILHTPLNAGHPVTSTQDLLNKYGIH